MSCSLKSANYEHQHRKGTDLTGFQSPPYYIYFQWHRIFTPPVGRNCKCLYMSDVDHQGTSPAHAIPCRRILLWSAVHGQRRRHVYPVGSEVWHQFVKPGQPESSHIQHEQHCHWKPGHLPPRRALPPLRPTRLGNASALSFLFTLVCRHTYAE